MNMAVFLKLKNSLFDFDKKNVNVCCNQVKTSNNFPVSHPVLDALRLITILLSQVDHLTSKRSWSIFSEHSFNPGIMIFTTISPLTKNTKFQLSEEHWLHIIHQLSMIYLLSISFCCSSGNILDLCSFYIFPYDEKWSLTFPLWLLRNIHISWFSDWLGCWTC